MPRLLFVVDDDSYFCSHRLELGRAAQRVGYEVIVATHVQHHGPVIKKEGFQLCPLRFRRGMQNPIHELATLLELIRLYRRVRPDIVHHVSIKLVAFGAVAARLTGVPAVVNAFTGLGYAFTAESRRARLVRAVLTRILRFGLAHPRNVTIVQNDSDLDDLVRAGIVVRSRSVLIRGAGVNTVEFTPHPEPEGDVIVLLASRMLWDKGVGEFAQAAKSFKHQGPRVRFALVGSVDPESSTTISPEQLQQWEHEGLIEWWGHRDNMQDMYRLAHIVVLPTYYGEGLPKVLLEAAACGKPLVATDWRGCREVLRHGENGLLVPIKNSQALASAIQTLVQDKSLRMRMGARGREIVVQEFSVTRISAETLDVYLGLIAARSLSE